MLREYQEEIGCMPHHSLRAARMVGKSCFLFPDSVQVGLNSLGLSQELPLTLPLNFSYGV